MRRMLGRVKNVYGALAAMEPKLYLAYGIWVWTQFFVQIISMTIFVYFWRAVYSNQATVGGLNLGQMLNYILLAQILAPLVVNRLVLSFSRMIRSGQLAVELLRPVDFQARAYVETLADLCVDLILKAPLVFLAIAVFGLQLPSDPWVYLAFLLTMALGHAVLFSFDWIFACLAFYSTETWGLSVIREGIALFFSGALVPLTLMPDWLRGIAAALPFAQALYVPASILSGITPLSAVPQSLVIQGAWLCGLGLVSRWVFRTALRVVTVQGG